MLTGVVRFLVIFFIVYASLFGGVVETNPLMKIAHQTGITVLIAVWLGSLVVRRRTIPATRFDWPLWALGIGWFFSAIFSDNPRVSLEYVYPIFIHLVLFYFLLDLIRSGHTRWIMEGLFITGGVIVVLGGIEITLWYFGTPILPQFAHGWPEIGGFTLPPVIHEVSAPLNYNNPTGAYGVLLIPLALTWANTLKAADLRWGLRLLAAGLLVIVVLTQSRGAYLGLAALAGAMGLIWLLRPDTRARLPKRLQPLLDPRVLLLVAAVAGLIAAFVLVQIIILPEQPNPNDVTRISLWYSAVRMFEDHPVLGVGRFQFKSSQLVYQNWEQSYAYLPLNHAHNLFFNVLAEGGIVLLALSTWVLVRLGRIGWAAWKNAPDAWRRRLEGALAALLAFGVHNMVDAFLQTQLMIPVVALAALIVAHDVYPVPERRPSRQRVPRDLRFALIAGIVVITQIAFVPLERAAWAQMRTSSYRAQERYEEALDSVRVSQKADPWLDLYKLEEANLLGVLADRDPETYLFDAITRHESSLTLAPTWDVGWHNLAALYAQAGDYTQAIDAEQRALDLNPPQPGYWFKLGEYHELAGEPEAAQDAYFEALKRRPFLAASDFWSDPAHPLRQQVLSGAIEHFSGLPVQFDLLFYTGRLDQFAALAATYTGEDSTAVEQRVRALWPDDSPDPCIFCFHVRGNERLLEAEIILHTAQPGARLDEAEEDARKALFVSENQDRWAWYILARVGQQTGAGEDTINDDLARAVAFPPDSRSHYADIYALNIRLDVIPQARVPIIGPISYEPWLELLQRKEQQGAWEDAETIREKIREADPYARLP